jgi:hypothetical protein
VLHELVLVPVPVDYQPVLSLVGNAKMYLGTHRSAGHTKHNCAFDIKGHHGLTGHLHVNEHSIVTHEPVKLINQRPSQVNGWRAGERANDNIARFRSCWTIDCDLVSDRSLAGPNASTVIDGATGS